MSAQQILDQLSQAIVDGEMEHTGLLAEEAVKAQVPAEEIVRVASMAMKRTGQLYESKEYFVADLIASAEAMKPVLQVVEPLIAANKGAAIGRVVIGTVQGDVHDIGKNLVATVLQTAGFEVYDLGINVPAKVFAEKALELDADVVGASAYTSTALAYQRDILTELNKAAPGRFKYVVGGAPTHAEWARNIGADGWAADAWETVKLVTQLVELRRATVAA